MTTQQTTPLSAALTPAAKLRGSTKLLAAWRARALSEESVNEIAEHLDQSRARIEGVTVAGGGGASGLTLSLAYDGDDGPWCGNDITFWLRWHLKHGGTVKPPRVIIDGTPFPDLVRLQLDFGTVPAVPQVNGALRGFNVGGFGG